MVNLHREMTILKLKRNVKLPHTFLYISERTIQTDM